MTSREPAALPGDEPLSSFDAALPWEQQQQVRINAVHTASRVHPANYRDDLGPMRIDQMEEFAYQMTDIEQLGQDPRGRHERLRSLGYRDVAQFERVRLTFLKYWGRALGPTLSEFVWDGSGAIPAMMAAGERRERERMSAVVAGNQELVASVEGVSLDDYARACLGASRGTFAESIAGLGMDAAKFERVSNGWTAKMASDTTGTLARLYADAFTKL